VLETRLERSPTPFASPTQTPQPSLQQNRKRSRPGSSRAWAASASAAPAAPAAQTLAPLSAAAITTPPHLAQADAILDEYRVPTNTLKSDVRKGCLLYFAGAFVLLGAGIALLWLAFRR